MTIFNRAAAAARHRSVRNLTGLRRVIPLLAAAFALVLIFGLIPPCTARAQGGILTGSLAPSGDELPPGVHRVGNVETASVVFENQTLFTVTGPVIRNR